MHFRAASAVSLRASGKAVHDGTPIGGGGAWTHGAPGKPSHVLASKDARFKIILPNLPNRVDVPAPMQPPWKGVALLNFFNHGTLVLVGTGFLCQPDVLVTAKHNLTAAQFDAAGVWLGFDAVRNPQVKPVAIKAWAVHRVLDLAVFVLSNQQFGAFELGATVPSSPGGVTIAGYAMPYPDGAPRLSFGIGAVTAVDPSRLAYAINTREGDSGAPVFVVSSGVPRALGVHTEAAASPQIGNSGVHLSTAVVTDLLKMIDFARAQVET